MDPLFGNHLIHPREFAQRNGVPVGAISIAMQRGEIPHVNGRLDPTVAQEAWDRLKLLVSHRIGIPFVGVEYLELAQQADVVHLTIPAHIRTQCGFPPYATNRRGKAASETRQVRHAFQRLTTAIMLTEAELRDLQGRHKADRPGCSLPQFIRIVLGYEPRLPLWPANTYERDVEMEHAWEKLERLGLNPRDYIPEY